MRGAQYVSGLNGEAAAEDYLLGQGMTCVARRYRAEDGEVDLVMEDGDCVVFVEVKARPGSAAGSGFAAVTSAKQKRLAHAAMHFLVEREWMARQVRFDVVEITAFGLRHVRNAFMPGAWL